MESCLNIRTSILSTGFYFKVLENCLIKAYSKIRTIPRLYPRAHTTFEFLAKNLICYENTPRKKGDPRKNPSAQINYT